MPSGIHAYGLDFALLSAIAVAADERGFDTMWLGEHIVLPVERRSEHPGHSTQTARPTRVVRHDVQLLDPWAAIAGIGVMTSRIKLATGMLIAPLRHPLATARSAVTVSAVTRGRFILGVGAGWLAEEFEILDVPFETRGERLDESIQIWSTLFRGGLRDFTGAHFAFGATQITPEPCHIPVVVGGNSAVALRRAASLGDGWFSSGSPSLDSAVSMVATAQRLREQSERKDRLRCWIRPDPECDLRRYEDAGLEDLVFHVDPDVLTLAGGSWERWLDELSEVTVGREPRHLTLRE